ncbi:MAG TPA: GGDEF domain-containing protein [Candidatus Omnitrophota bacterium]|nr:GGDEF domain-containing protein [Candidatus Omnitrophota bacterium]
MPNLFRGILLDADALPMIKDLRQNPIFGRKKEEKETAAGVPGFPSEMLSQYKELVDQTVAFRTRIMVFVGTIMHLAFHFLDRAVYPDQAGLFLKMRLTAGILSLVLCAPCFFKTTYKYSIWSIDLVAIIITTVISLMIYLTNGTASDYHGGISLTLVGMAVVNGFYFWHCLVVCLIVMVTYFIAALASTAAQDLVNFFSAFCFMISTTFFVVLLTRFYSIQHFKAFLHNEELKENERKLEVLYGIAQEKAKVDDLTKIYNRRYFFEILEEKIKTAKTAGTFFYLIIFDIDNFKPINDTHGHVFGDQVIAAVAKVLRNTMRSNSYIGRYGGDEFMLIIDKATKEEFFARVQIISRAIQNLEFYCNEKKVTLSASFGAARFDPDKGMDEKKLIELADNALLEVKRTKRGEIKLIN